MVATVRPWLRRTARVVLPILILIGVFQIWDNLAWTRVESAYVPLIGWEMAAAVKPKESVPTGDERAGRYYAAAAVMAIGTPTDGPPSMWQLIARQREHLAGGRPLTPEEAEAFTFYASRGELISSLIERGAPLRFHTIPAGAAPQLRASGLMSAGRFEDVQTLQRILAGDRAGALRSIVARLRLLRAYDYSWFSAMQKSVQVSDAATDLGLALAAGGATDAQLDDIDRAFSEVYADWEPTASAFAAARSQYQFAQAVSEGRSWQFGALGALVSPVVAGSTHATVRTVAAAMEASRRSWPQRLDEMQKIRNHGAVGDWLLRRFSAGGIGVAEMLQAATRNIANGVAAARMARLQIAIERYRRANGRSPALLAEMSAVTEFVTDPFTGRPFKYAPAPDGYLLYSVSSNGKDDGGMIRPATPPGAIPGLGPRPDLGVRVRYREAT
jgi:hypothetical protein